MKYKTALMIIGIQLILLSGLAVSMTSWIDIGDGNYAKQEFTKIVNKNELQSRKDLLLNSLPNITGNEQEVIDNCMKEAEKQCKAEFDNTVFEMQSEINKLNEILSNLK